MKEERGTLITINDYKIDCEFKVENILEAIQKANSGIRWDDSSTEVTRDVNRHISVYIPEKIIRFLCVRYEDWKFFGRRIFWDDLKHDFNKDAQIEFDIPYEKLDLYKTGFLTALEDFCCATNPISPLWFEEMKRGEVTAIHFVLLNLQDYNFVPLEKEMLALLD